jgi:hypothetical protein
MTLPPDFDLSNALVIDRKTARALVALRKRAKKNPVPYDQVTMRNRLHALNPDGVSAVGESQFVEIAVGYRVVYSIEEVHPSVFCQHMSISGPNAFPHPTAVEFLMQVFRYKHPLLDCMVYSEPVSPTAQAPTRVAINVVAPLAGDMDAFLDALQREGAARRADRQNAPSSGAVQ